LLAFLVELLVVVSGYWLDGFPFALAGAGVWPVMLGMGLIRLFSLLVYLIIGITVVSAVLSWVNPMTPLMPVVQALSEPFLRPIRRFSRWSPTSTCRPSCSSSSASWC